MDGQRTYPDEPEGRWQPYPGPDDRYRVPDPRYGEEPSLYVEVSGDLARGTAGPGVAAGHEAQAATFGSRPGADAPPPTAETPYVPEPAFKEVPGFQTEPLDRASLRRPPAPPPPPPGPSHGPAHGVGPSAAPAASPEPAGGAIYRTRRAGTAALLVAVAVVAELMLVRIPFSAEFAHPVQPAGVLGGIFAMAGVPLATMGLYGLMTGAATAAGPNPGRAWLRTPLAYLPVGLLLIIAGALAA